MNINSIVKLLRKRYAEPIIKAHVYVHRDISNLNNQTIVCGIVINQKNGEVMPRNSISSGGDKYIFMKLKAAGPVSLNSSSVLIIVLPILSRAWPEKWANVCRLVYVASACWALSSRACKMAQCCMAQVYAEISSRQRLNLIWNARAPDPAPIAGEIREFSYEITALVNYVDGDGLAWRKVAGGGWGGEKAGSRRRGAVYVINWQHVKHQ